MKAARIIVVMLIAAMGSIALATDVAKPALVTRTVEWSIPGVEVPEAWFVRSEIHGLEVSEGTLLLGGKKLELPEVTAARVAGAYYPKHGILLTVEADGSADSYRKEGEAWKLSSRLSPDVECRNEKVRLTIVPGLVYLLNYDVKHEMELKSQANDRQEYADVYRRVCLTEKSQEFHGVPLNVTGELVLGAAYRQPAKAGKTVLLCTSEHEFAEIELKLPPAEPFRSGPGDDLAQSVFVFPTIGVIALTVGGWSVTDAAGKSLGVYSTKDIQSGWWSDPSYADGQFMVHLRTGPGGVTYKVDRERGKLVEVKK